MALRLCKSTVLTIGLFGSTMWPANAKPPEVPTAPTTEFKVLPSFSQEHFQPESTTTPKVFLPESVSGLKGDCSSLISHWPSVGLEVAKRPRQWMTDRLERVAFIRIASETGVEQSEEPPFAAGIELLNVVPRLAQEP